MAELDVSKKVADRYLKREVLGEGTYGVVYKAIDTQVTYFFSSTVNLFSVFFFVSYTNYEQNYEDFLVGNKNLL